MHNVNFVVTFYRIYILQYAVCSSMASRVGQNYQARTGKMSDMDWQNVTPCLTFYLFMPDVHLFMLDILSVHAWRFICPCLMFIICHVLDILSVCAWYLICSCLIFYLSVLDIYLSVLDILSVHAWYFICSCLIFYLFMLDI